MRGYAPLCIKIAKSSFELYDVKHPPPMEDDRILKLLSERSKDLKKVASLLGNARPEEPADQRWIDRLDVENLLGVSESTVRRP